MHELYTQYKGLMFKLAYQLTGSVTDAEDVVQDVFVKVFDVAPAKLAEPKAYLCKMVANRCRDLHKTARKKREVYYGEWLPEPFLQSDYDIIESAVRGDLLSYGMLVLLEKLTVSERIVFVLREALDFDYVEIARLTEKSEVNCRKLYSRARAKMNLDSETTAPINVATQEWVRGFLEALKQGNMEQLLSLLDQDVVSVSDGGGKAVSSVDPIEKRDAVANFLLGPLRRLATINGEPRFEIVMANGQPSFMIRSEEGVHTVGMLQVANNRLYNLYFIRNPDKLKQLHSKTFSDPLIQV